MADVPTTSGTPESSVAQRSPISEISSPYGSQIGSDEWPKRNPVILVVVISCLGLFVVAAGALVFVIIDSEDASTTAGPKNDDKKQNGEVNPPPISEVLTSRKPRGRNVTTPETKEATPATETKQKGKLFTTSGVKNRGEGSAGETSPAGTKVVLPSTIPGVVNSATREATTSSGTVVVLPSTKPVVNNGTTKKEITETPTEEIEKAKPVPSDFLVCTVNGEGPLLKTLKFQVNLCSVTFFDSFYKATRDEVTGNFSNNVHSFLNWPKTYPNAEFGFSFSLSNDRLKRALLNGILPDQIKDLYETGIRHAAVMNIYGYDVNEDGFTVALDVLKISYKVFLEFNSTNPSYVVLGVAIDDRSKFRLVDLMKNRFIPSLFISVTHGSYDDRARADCRILPPTWHSSSIPRYVQPSEVTYGRTLSCDLLSEVTRAGIQVPLAISFSLSGRLYKPRQGDHDLATDRAYKLFRPCQDSDGGYYVSPGEVPCTPGTKMYDNFRKQQASDLLSTYDTAMKRTLTFDNGETMRNKVCKMKTACTSVRFGLAAYDVEYDALETECKRFGLLRHFGRVTFLQNMDHYLKSLTLGNAVDKAKCLNVSIES